MNISLDDYRFDDAGRILTPFLAVYPRFVESNIDATLRLMGGDANRWRPHLKTAKMPWAIRRLMARGVTRFKCATTRELLVALETGAPDVLVAYPLVGANAQRVIGIAALYPEARVSVLVENVNQAAAWIGRRIGIFIDVNPGMDRTGIGQDSIHAIGGLAKFAGAQFRGLHYYDGHISAPDLQARERQVHAGYDHLFRIVSALKQSAVPIDEVITSGTPAFPYAMTYPGFRAAGFVHRASPGTVLFNDLTSLSQLPVEFSYHAAALVVATVVSHPAARRITCDAGHKSVSADAGLPACMVVGRPDLEPLKPSEEHLPIEVPRGSAVPEIGEMLYLLPRHVCPTVNNFDEALMVVDGRFTTTESVAARGHESALPTAAFRIGKVT